MALPIAKVGLTWFAALWLLQATCIADVYADATIPAFELRRGDEHVGYLIGTMHTDDPRVMAMLEPITPLLARVEVVAIELVPDGIAMLAIGAASMLPGEDTLRAQIGAERFAALLRAARLRGLPESLLDRLKPWAAAVTLGLPELSGDQVMDSAIYLQAVERGMRVVGLENPSEQVRVFDDMPDALQLELLDAMIKNGGMVPMQVEALTVAYLSGDLDRIDEVARAQYADVPPALAQWFQKTLIDQRNATMLRRLLPLFEDGRVLVAVGAMHLGGENGLVAGLQQAGLAAFPLSGSRREQSIPTP
jgi:uncharacterized protein YbaP (TraB family)